MNQLHSAVIQAADHFSSIFVEALPIFRYLMKSRTDSRSKNEASYSVQSFIVAGDDEMLVACFSF